ncbi:MAG: ATP-binding protein, partial [Bacteroidota bacterium]
WLGTSGGGLIRLETEYSRAIQEGKDQPHYQQFTTEEGLTNNQIYAVYEDGRENLWLSSDYGIIKFHKHTFETKAYLPKDGITHHEFNRISHYRDNDSMLYFGGLNGVTAFNPKDFYQSSPNPQFPLLIKDFQQFDSRENQLLNRTEDLRDNARIILRPENRFFLLEYALLDFQNPGKIQYRWKVDGFDPNFIYTRKNLIRVSGLPPGNYELVIQGQIATGRWSPNGIRIPIRVIAPFYQQTWFFLLITVLIIAAVYSYIKVRNITLRKRQRILEQQVQERTQTIEKQAAELRQLNQLKNRLFANVSHELRTPLSLIIGPINSILGRKNLDKSLKGYLEIAQKNSQKLLRLVTQILDLSKLESGKMQLKESGVNLEHTIRSILEGFDLHARFKHISLVYNFGASQDLLVFVDKEKLETILSNLLSNAVKYTPAKGRVELKVREENGKILVSVRDTGPGIDPLDLPYLFDRFYQSCQDEYSEAGGTGIGLALSKELAELMNGELIARNHSTGGADFLFKFPKKELIGSLENTTSEELAPGSPVGLSGYGTLVPPPIIQRTFQVLLVEDNPDMSEYIRKILGETAKVIFAEHGRQALDFLEEAEIEGKPIPDLIITDLMMPVMNGLQLIEILKQDGRWHQIPVIMLTARADKRDKFQALRSGVDDYMLKPFVAEELIARVSALLNFVKQRERVGTPLQEVERNAASITKVDQHWLVLQEKILKRELTNPNFNATQWAGEAGISERQLQRKLKSLIGASPKQYILELRLNEARKLLEDKVYPTVAEVAYAVGFSNPQGLTRNFRKRFGKPPSEYL